MIFTDLIYDTGCSMISEQCPHCVDLLTSVVSLFLGIVILVCSFAGFCGIMSASTMAGPIRLVSYPSLTGPGVYLQLWLWVPELPGYWGLTDPVGYSRLGNDPPPRRVGTRSDEFNNDSPFEKPPTSPTHKLATLIRRHTIKDGVLKITPSKGTHELNY